MTLLLGATAATFALWVVVILRVVVQWLLMAATGRHQAPSPWQRNQKVILALTLVLAALTTTYLAFVVTL